MDNTVVTNTVRIIGIVITAMAIQFSLLSLLALQGVGAASTWEILLYIIAAIINMFAISVILIGFIIRYKMMLFLYAAAIHFVFFLTIAVMIFTGSLPGDVVVPLIFTIPSALYLIGWQIQRK